MFEGVGGGGGRAFGKKWGPIQDDITINRTLVLTAQIVNGLAMCHLLSPSQRLVAGNEA